MNPMVLALLRAKLLIYLTSAPIIPQATFHQSPREIMLEIKKPSPISLESHANRRQALDRAAHLSKPEKPTYQRSGRFNQPKPKKNRRRGN
jgi:hypothetical protein